MSLAIHSSWPSLLVSYRDDTKCQRRINVGKLFCRLKLVCPFVWLHNKMSLEFIITSSTLPRMSCQFGMFCEMESEWPYDYSLVGSMLSGFVQNSPQHVCLVVIYFFLQAFRKSPYDLAIRACLQIWRIPILLYQRCQDFYMVDNLPVAVQALLSATNTYRYNRRCPTETITNDDYADDLVLLTKRLA